LYQADDAEVQYVLDGLVAKLQTDLNTGGWARLIRDFLADKSWMPAYLTTGDLSACLDAFLGRYRVAAGLNTESLLKVSVASRPCPGRIKACAACWLVAAADCNEQPIESPDKALIPWHTLRIPFEVPRGKVSYWSLYM